MLKCFAPYIDLSISVHEDALKINPCCKIYPEPAALDSDLINNEFISKIRRDLHKKENNSDCDYCWKAEKNNLISWRQLEGQVPDKWKNVNLLEHERGTLFQFLKLTFDNVCDSACVYCNTNNSNTWIKEISKNSDQRKLLNENVPYRGWNGREPNEDLTKSANTVKNLLRYLGSKIPLYEDYFNIAFLGGEPFLSPHLTDGKFMEYINAFYEHAPKDFSLIYEFNTNCNTPKKLIDKQIKLIEESRLKYKNAKPKIVISGEAYGPALEYVRYGTKWKRYKENVELYFSNPIFQINLNMAINVFSIPNLFEYFTFMFHNASTYNKKLRVTAGCVNRPDALHPNVLPERFSKYIDITINLINDNQHLFFDDTQYSAIKNVLTNLHQEIGSATDLTPQLKNYVKYFKIVRNMDIANYVPELHFLND